MESQRFYCAALARDLERTHEVNSLPDRSRVQPNPQVALECCIYAAPTDS